MKVFHRFLEAALIAALVSGCQNPSNEPPAASSPPPAGQPASQAGDPTPAPEQAETGGQLPTPELGQILPEDPELEAKAEELRESFSNGSFPAEARRDPDNGPLFVYLAARETETDRVKDSLQALLNTHAPNKAVVDEDYVTVVTALVASPDPDLQRSAFRAAYRAVEDKGPAELKERLLVLVQSGFPPEVRKQALELLGSFPERENDEEIEAALLQATQADEPYLVVAALHHLDRLRRDLSDLPAARQRALDLLGHEDPAVVSNALRVLVTATGDDTRAETIEILEEQLKSEDPMVRTKAVTGLGTLKARESLQAMSPLLDDQRENRGRLEFRHTDGFQDHVLISHPQPRVDLATLTAIRALSFGMKPKLEVKSVGARADDEEIAEAVAQTRAWIAEVEGSEG